MSDGRNLLAEEAPTSSGGKNLLAEEPKDTSRPMDTRSRYAEKMGIPQEAVGQYSPVPFFAAGAGETIRGLGAATQLVAPEIGKKLSKAGEATVSAVKEKYPVAGTVGQVASYAVPYFGAESAITRLLPRTGALGREALIAGGAGGTTGFLTTEGDLVDRAFGGALGTSLGIAGTYGAALATKGYQYTKDLLQKAFGGDAKRMANALKDYATRRTGAEAEAAKKMAAEAEQTAGIAKTAEQKAVRQQELAYRDLPGTKTEKEAGRFKAVPTSEQAVGDRIRGYVEKVYKDLKAVRANNAEKLKGAPFYMAAEAEMLGQRVANTNAYKQMERLVRNQIRDEQGLIGAPGATGAKLKELENILTGTVVDDATGVVVKNDLSYQGMERLRRQLNDRSYGFPETGFDALSQQEAGKYAQMVTQAMEEFSPGLKRFLDQYKKDSEPLQVFRTKTGKLFEEQLPGVKGYAAVPSENIPSRVFANRESYQGLIEALGNNKALAESEARKYFASQMEKLAGDPKKLEDFIRDNRTMLNLTNARDMAESYIARASAFAKRGEFAAARGEQATKAREVAAAQSEKYKNLNLEFRSARQPQEIAAANEKFAQQLLDDKFISEEQYLRYLNQSNRIEQSITDAAEAKKQLAYLAARTLGWGFLGGGAFAVIKSVKD